MLIAETEQINGISGRSSAVLERFGSSWLI